MSAAAPLPLLPDATTAVRLGPPPGAAPDIAFVLDLGKALHRYGLPAHRLEELLRLVCARLGLESQFVSTPTAIFASFGSVEQLRTGVIRVEPGEPDLGRLSELDLLTDEVIRGACSVEEGTVRLRQILQAPVRYRPSLVIVGHVLSAASGARLFGGHVREIVVAALIGLIVGPLSILAARSTARARVLEPVAAMLATILAVACERLMGPLSVEVATLAGLIVLLPGLSLTVALTEIATRNLISGTSRLTGAALVFLELAFGVALGAKLAGLVFVRADPPVELPMPPWTMGAAIVVITISLVVLFQARFRDAGWILLATAFTYWGTKLGTSVLGPELGAFGGALLLGVAGNHLATRFSRPTMLFNLPGLVLLVPGSIGFRSVQSLLERDIINGIETAFSMALVGIAIVAGLLVANVVVVPRKAL